MDYVETRSKLALAIDRSKNAKTRYDSFNSKYKESPNTSDVEDYDTKGKFVEPPKTTKTETKVEKSNTEYEPTPAERKKLLPFFHKMQPIEQHKDLLKTHNVIKNKEDIEKWKKNPKQFDIRGIDTQPKELIEERLKVAHSYAKEPTTIKKGYGWIRREGDYQASRDLTNPGRIRIDTKGKNVDFTHAHELGHAIDRNIFGIPKGKYTTGNISFVGAKKINKDTKNWNFATEKNDAMKIKNINQVEKVTREVISPYKATYDNYAFHRYRTSREELFANWFGGYITKPNVVRGQSRGYYNVFKKENKNFVKNIKISDLNVTKKYMGGKYAKKFKIF